MGRFDGATSSPPDNAGIRQSNDLSRMYGSQGVLTFEVGAKVQDNIFVGGYLAGGLGGSGSDLSSLCARSDITCLSGIVRLGFQFKYHFIPSGRVNPWAGVGLGYESASLSARGPGGRVSISSSGPEFPLSLGADFRLNKQIGVGPIAELTAAVYNRAELTSTTGQIESGRISNTGLHSWLTLGARVVFLP